MTFTFQSVNPATGASGAEYPIHGDDAVSSILDAAVAAQRDWRRADIAMRTSPLRRAAALLRERRDALARLAANEMGKPVAEGRAEIDKCAWVCEYYAEAAAAQLAPEIIDTGAATSRVHFEPLGTVLAVMPWNYPFWQVFRWLAPALAAGNSGLLKHASNVCGCALEIEAIGRDAGLPAGLFRALLIDSGKVAGLIEDPRVAAVTLTGSTSAGRAVGAAAGKAIKPSVLELGGSDAYVVLADADIELAADKCVTSRLLNTGQSCIAAKRFIVVADVLDEFTEAVRTRLAAVTTGDPLDDETRLGPMARPDLRDELHEQVRSSVAAGARCLLGGEMPEGPGAFYPVTLLTNVAPGMPAFDDELFGPVASIVPATDENDAIELANRSAFGLGAAVFTRDIARGEHIAATRLEAGSCFVNDFVKSDPRLPFGGIKTSGYGRELGTWGIRAFVNVKTVYRP